MLTNKRKYLTWVICLLLGMGYVSAMSNLEMHYFFKSLIIFLPIQLITVIYVSAKLWGNGDWRLGVMGTGKGDKGKEQ